MQRHVQAHGWWRDYYETHPRKGINGSDAWGTGKSQKYKMYCKECWIHHFAGIKDEHRLADQNGTVCSYPREDPEITEYCTYGTLYFYKKKKKTEDLICSVGTVCNRWASRSRELSYRSALIGSLYISKSSCDMRPSNCRSKTACDQ